MSGRASQHGSACPSDDVLVLMAGGRPCRPDDVAHVTGCRECSRRLAEVRGQDAFLAEVALAERARPVAGAGPGFVDVPGYVIEGEIGRGGQGVVYLATQEQTKRRVALKVLLRGAFASTRERARFEREVEIAAALRHPNIVTVFEARAMTEGGVALVMEHVEGAPLDEWLRMGVEGASRREVRRRAVRLMAKVARAVGHAHQRGVIHRDLKPSNVLVDAGGEPHILDFGLARFQGTAAGAAGGPVGEGVGFSAGAQTISGVFQGTPAYASPEQCAGAADRMDTRSDVYSLGAMTYEVVTGSLPHSDTGSSTIAFGSRRSGALALSSMEAARRGGGLAVPPDLDAVLMMSLAPDPGARYQSVEAFAHDLEAVLSGQAVSARAHEVGYWVRKTARRYRVALAIIGVIFAGASSAAWIFARQAGELSRRADSLSAALERSAIEQARAMVRAGHVPQAEQLLWPALLRSHADGALLGASSPGADAGFVGRPEHLHAYWAVWELLARHPCRATGALGSGGPELIYLEEGAVVLVDHSGGVRRLNLPGLDGGAEGTGGRLGLPRDSTDGAWSYSLSRGGMAAAWTPTQVRVQDVRTGKVVCDCAFAGRIQGAQLDGDEKRMYLVDDDALMVRGLGSKDAARVLLDGLRARGPNPEFSTWCLLGGDDCFVKRESDGSISLWDLRTMERDSISRAPGSLLEQIGERGPASGSALWGVARSPDRRWLALLINRDVLLVDRWNQDVQHRLEGSPTTARDQLSFSDDGRWLACGGTGQGVLVWSIPSGRLEHEWAGHTTGIKRPQFVPRRPWLVTSDLFAVKLWDLDASEAWRAPLSGGPGYSSLEVRFDPWGRRVAAVGDDGAVRVWVRAGEGAPTRTSWGDSRVIAGGRVESSSVDFSPDGEMVAFAGHDGVVRVCRSQNGQEVGRFDAGTDRVECVRFSPDGGRLIWGRNDGIIEVVSIADGSVHRFPGVPPGEAPSRVAQLAITRDGKTVFVTFASVSASHPSFVAGYSLADGRMHWRLSVPLPMRAIALAPDGRSLAVTSDDNRIRVLSAADGSLVRMLEGVTTRAFGLAFHPLGNLLFSVHLSGQMAVWDVRTGDAIASFQAHDGSAYGVAISPDGTILATCGETAGVVGQTYDRAETTPTQAPGAGQVRVWDLTYFRAHLAGNLKYWQSRGADASGAKGATIVDGAGNGAARQR